jgi:hypothetical protein
MMLIQFRELDPSGVLQCLDVPIPEPQSGAVFSRAHTIGVGMLAAGKLHLRIHARLPLAEAKRPHELLASGDVLGKLLLHL